MQLIGALFIGVSTIDEGSPPFFYAGLFLAFAGGVMELISFNDIGNACEELKETDEVLTE